MRTKKMQKQAKAVAKKAKERACSPVGIMAKVKAQEDIKKFRKSVSDGREKLTPEEIKKLSVSSMYGKFGSRSKLNQQVRDFHQKFGHPIGQKPGVPNDTDLIRCRLRLITEEFFELLAACEIWPTLHLEHEVEWRAEQIILDAIADDFIDPSVVNFPELIDALGDMDYINEGFRVVCGVNGGPIADEIHVANMNKTSNGLDKPIKNKGWKAPDIAAELKRQGWVKR